MYKIGDKVQVISSISMPQNGQYYCSQYLNVGEVFTLRTSLHDNYNGIYWLFEEKNSMGGQDKWAFEFQLKLVSSVEQNKAEKKTMNIKEQFLLAITAEPQKSFRKAGITNGDDLLTDDGQKVFLSWLLKQNQDTFKKEVVDPILADIEKEKK